MLYDNVKFWDMEQIAMECEANQGRTPEAVGVVYFTSRAILTGCVVTASVAGRCVYNVLGSDEADAIAELVSLLRFVCYSGKLRRR